MFLPGIEFIAYNSFPSVVIKVVPFLSGLHVFRQEICCQSKWCFLWLVFKIFFSLPFIFRHLIMRCIGMDFHGFILLKFGSAFWKCSLCLSPFIFRKSKSIISLKLFQPTLLLLSFWDSNNTDVGPSLFSLFSLFSASFLRSFPFYPLFFSPLFRLGKFYWSVIKWSNSLFCHLQTDIEPNLCVFIFAVVFFSFIISIWFFLKLFFFCFYNFYFYFSFILKGF